MIIYLSGPMSGIDGYNFPAFHAAAEKLRKLGHAVINPAEIKPSSKKWVECMRADIKAMLQANTVAVLPGWEESKGAKIEVFLALQLGMEIVDAKTLKPIKVDVSLKTFR